MGKQLKDLIGDIFGLFDQPRKVTQEQADQFGSAVSKVIMNRLTEYKERRHISMSNVGTACKRKLWYQVNKPELGEKLPGPARLKFLFGDLVEQMIILLAKVAGHSVTEEQKEVHFAGITGHTDCRIDGVLVDVKSASTAAMDKFKPGGLEFDDPFAYLSQLRSYTIADGSATGAFLAVDKTLGNLVLAEYPAGDPTELEKQIEYTKMVVNRPEPPDRAYTDELDGKSGNRKLGTACSYCAFRSDCWPGLRTFLYSGRPRFLTRVDRLPDVPELKNETASPSNE